MTDAFGCINFDTVLVDVFENVFANAGADIDTCANVLFHSKLRVELAIFGWTVYI